MKKVIDATTDADTSVEVNIPGDNFISFAATGLGAETIVIEPYLEDGVYLATVPAIELTAAQDFVQVAGPATYRINKPSTAAPVAVYIEE